MIARRGKLDVAMVLLLLTVGVLAWRVMRIGLADEWSRTSPSKALFWRPDEPRALRGLAERALANKQYDAARNFARRGIGTYPLDGINYRVLAMAEAAQGRISSVATLLAIAASRSPRDMPTRSLIASYALRAGDVSKGLHQLDLMMRIQPEIQLAMLPRIAALAEIPEARSGLTHLLGQNPEWRGDFLRVLATQLRDSASVVSIFSALKLSDLETGLLIDRQVRDMDFTSAYVSWVASLPAQQQGALGNVFDGQFRFPPSNAGFGWQLTRDVEVEARINALPDGSGNGFSADFEQARTRFDGLAQRVVLAPGPYIFRGRTRSSNLTTSRGLQWEVSCADGRTLADSPLVTGTQPWTRFEIRFEVPVEKCGGQWLRFQMGAADRIDGHVETTDISIERSDSGPADIPTSSPQSVHPSPARAG